MTQIATQFFPGRAKTACAAALAALVLAACGGGGGEGQAPASGTALSSSRGASDAQRGLPSVKLTALVRRTPVEGSVVDHEFRIQVSNGPLPVANAVARLVGTGEGSHVVSGFVKLGDLGGYDKAKPEATVTIRHDTALGAIDRAALQWSVNALGPAPLGVDCADFAQVDLPETTLTATRVAEGTVVGGEAQHEHCVVEGRMNPRVGVNGVNYYTGFRLRLPVAWNGRFLFQGGGGNDGSLGSSVGPRTGYPSALAAGYAVVSTDGGHQGGSAAFRLDPQARIDHAYAAYVRVTDAAKALIVHGYGKLPDYAYFMGGSGGGRQAMMFPQRFPDRFDGIVAISPAMRAVREAAIAAVHTANAYRAAAPRNAQGQPIIGQALSNGDLALLSNAILAQCDALDGAVDQMVSVQPERCTFDPVVLQCPGAKNASCLSEAQVNAVRADFAGPDDPSGRPIYYRFPWNTGITAAGWRSWKLSGATLLGGNLGYQFTPPDPGFDYLGFDYARDFHKLDEQAEMLGVSSTDLADFLAHGGKMILAHGTGDGAFSPLEPIDYMKQLEARHGVPAVQSFFRLYIVPGMTHVNGGPATDQYDPLTALEQWVEDGVAPGSLLARAGNATPWPGRTRPLCPYPTFAKYVGTGSLEDAASFACATE
jgi:feruloyl esterase